MKSWTSIIGLVSTASILVLFAASASAEFINRRCARFENGRCVSGMTVKRALGCSLDDPFMPCVVGAGKRFFQITPAALTAAAAPLKRAPSIECLGDPYCGGKRDMPVSFDSEKRALGCSLDDPFMPCGIGKRDMPVQFKSEKRALGCSYDDPFMPCGVGVGKRGIEVYPETSSIENNKRALGCSLDDPFMPCGVGVGK